MITSLYPSRGSYWREPSERPLGTFAFTFALLVGVAANQACRADDVPEGYRTLPASEDVNKLDSAEVAGMQASGSK